MNLSDTERLERELAEVRIAYRRAVSRHDAMVSVLRDLENRLELALFMTDEQKSQLLLESPELKERVVEIRRSLSAKWSRKLDEALNLLRKIVSVHEDLDSAYMSMTTCNDREQARKEVRDAERNHDELMEDVARLLRQYNVCQ